MRSGALPLVLFACLTWGCLPACDGKVSRPGDGGEQDGQDAGLDAGGDLDGAGDGDLDGAGDGDLDGAGDGDLDGAGDGDPDGAGDGDLDGGGGDGDLDGGGGDDGGCQDPCPVATGVPFGCRTRFMYGVNWAWKNWCGDFGGVSAWGFSGVAADRQAFSADMAAMKAAGVNVIRWWMFPRFLSDSITWGTDDAPSGIGGTLLSDVEAALELAEEHDLYLMLTLFSFDSFNPTADEAGIWSRSIQPMVVDPTRRQKLIDELVRPIAQAVEASPYRERMIAWDLINEPEWAVSGPNPNGGADFEPNPACETVDHAQMKTFLDELAACLRANNPTALLTVGGAAIKWGTAWIDVDQDFYSLHYYDWVYQWFPYDTVTPASIGLTDKPVVIGEFPIGGLNAVGGHPARSAAEYAADMWELGYGGTLAWAYNDSSFPWDPALLTDFASAHTCETAY